MNEISSETISRFNLYSPTDYRYGVDALQPYLSNEAFVRYKAKVEATLAEILAKHGVCSREIAEEIVASSRKVTPREIAEEEKRIRHDIRALVNVIRSRVSDRAKPYVHLAATSYDISDTANSLRYQDAVRSVILPDMIKLEKTWIEIAKRTRDVIQIGRTHGQFASPITFGFAIAQYVDRWGERILRLRETANALMGKFSGAVGAYNALALLVPNAEELEKDLLSTLGIKAARISSQIVPAEPLTDLIHTIVSAWGVMANFSRDMRHLQRSEIGEVGEKFSDEQVGSSTMPQKRNPESFENVESLWKEFVPRMITKYLDQVSEHQRDLTNSASQRYDTEFLIIFDYCIRRLTRVCRSLAVDEINIRRNFDAGKDGVVSEPVYVLLALVGHPDAHEYVRKLNQEAQRSGRTVKDLLFSDKSVEPYLRKMTKKQLDVIREPSQYVGIAPTKVDEIVAHWEQRLREEEL